MRTPAVALLFLSVLWIGSEGSAAIASVPLLLAQQAPTASSTASATPRTAGRQVLYYEAYQDVSPASAAGDRASVAAPASNAFPAPTATGRPSTNFPSPILAPAPAPMAAPAIPADAVPILLGEQATPVAEVQIVGADAELQRLIEEAVAIQPGSVVNQEQLQRDVNAILSTGFFTAANASTFSRPTGLLVVYQVQPILVRSLQLVGARALTQTIANQIVQPQLGQPVNPATLRQSATQINQWYRDNGYVLGQVVNLRANPQGVVTVEVVEGVINTINIRFLNEAGEPIDGRTQDAFIRRELQLQPGQVFNQVTVQQDLQNLARLGIFEDVEVDLTGEGQAVAVTYTLQERLSRSFNVGGGINNTSGVFGAVTYQDQNFGGIGQRLGSSVQVGSQGLEFSSNFTNPYRPSDPDRLGYRISGFRQRTLSPGLSNEVTLPNGDRIREGQFGGGVAVMRPIEEWDAELGLNYTRISMRDREGNIAAVDEQGNPLTFSNTGIDDLTTLSFQVAQDRRNNSIAPSQGSVLTLRTEQSIPVGNGNVLMNRLQANYAQYIPIDLLDMGTPNSPEVLAFNIQGGTILGDVAAYNAFDLGGANSVRGYGEGQAGTGRTYLQATAEYRFPLFSPVGAVLFADFATDLGSGDTVLGEPAEIRDKPGTAFGIGVGVRVRSPLGLIRADFGLNDQGGGRLHLGIGERF